MDDATRLLTEKYNGTTTPEYSVDLARLEAGEPLAYVIGWIPFLGATIWLDSRPLIPRAETEYWTEKLISDASQKSARTALDLFAGSGCVGIALLMANPNIVADFGDIEAIHFDTVKKNALENGIDPQRLRTIQTDVWSNISSTYDVIAANPPYLSHNRTARIQDSVREHEPEIALFAEDDGFELIRRFLSGLPQRLASEGIAYLEHEPDHVDSISKLATTLGLKAVNHKDQYGRERYTTLQHMA